MLFRKETEEEIVVLSEPKVEKGWPEVIARGHIAEILEIVGMDSFVVLIVSFLAFTYYVLFLSRKAKNGVPPEWPFVGMLPSLFIHFNDLYDSISRILIGCGGTFIVKGLPQPTVLTSDPANVEYILTTKFSSFQKGPSFRSAFTDVFGDGMFNVDGELWIQQRKASVVEVVFNYANYYDCY
jgi:hypothetical protein